MEHGLDINAKDDRHRTPLFDAVMLGDETAVRVLLELGAYVWPPGHNSDSRGWFQLSFTYCNSDVLIQAVERKTTSILRMLLASIQEDRKIPDEQKRISIISAFNVAHKMRETVVEDLLLQELQLYREGKSDNNHSHS